MTITEGYADFEGSRTWYRVRRRVAAAADGPAPLVVLHGGPGGTHDYLLPLADLARRARRAPSSLYDQLGNGRLHAPP